MNFEMLFMVSLKVHYTCTDIDMYIFYLTFCTWTCMCLSFVHVEHFEGFFNWVKETFNILFITKFFRRYEGV